MAIYVILQKNMEKTGKRTNHSSPTGVRRMKTLYFDCSSGISGNMVLGALTEIIGDQEYLVRELEKLHLEIGRAHV